MNFDKEQRFLMSDKSLIDEAYNNKRPEYFGNVRKEIVPLLPQECKRMLEIGCGKGDTLKYLKQLGRCDWAAGVELTKHSADIARNELDFVIEGNIENIALPFDEESFDVIMCLDVLEHMVDPWQVMSNLQRLLRPGGVLIASVPNVRCFRVVLPLLLKGEWNYSEEGILDKTHLRFFTRRTAISLIESGGFHVDMVRSTGLQKWSKTFIVNALSLNVFKPFFEFQYLIRGIKSHSKS